MASLLHRMARWVAHHPIKGLILWLVIVVGLTAVVSLVGAQTTNDTSLPGTQSQDATNVLAADFPPTENGTSPIVFKVKTGTVNSTANKNAITASVKAIAKVPHVTQATSPYGNAAQYLQSKSKTIAYTPVLMNVSAAAITDKQAQAVLDAAEPAVKAGIQVAAGGTVGATLSNPNTDASTVIGLIAAVIILAISFGTLIAMFIPIISAVLGLALGLALIGLLGHVVSVPSIAPTLATMIGLGVGIDYALFVVSRHREQLANGMDPKESVALAVGTAGTAVVFAGGTLVLALLSLAVAGIPLISSLGYGSSLAVVTAVLAATLLLPSVLSLLGHKLNSLPIFPRHKAAKAAATGGVWGRWGGFVSRHPWWMLLVGLAILIPMAIPVVRMNLGQEDVGVSSLKTTQRQAYNLMSEGFGVGYNGPLLVAVQLNPPAKEDPTVAAEENEAKALQAQLEQEQAQGQAQQAQLEAEAAQVKAEAAVLTAQRKELDAQAQALAAKRDKLVAQAQALRTEARGDALARAAAFVQKAEAQAAKARAAGAKYKATTAEIHAVQAQIAAVEAEIAATVDPVVLDRLQKRKADLQARVDALIAQADLQQKAVDDAKAKIAEYRARPRNHQCAAHAAAAGAHRAGPVAGRAGRGARHAACGARAKARHAAARGDPSAGQGGVARLPEEPVAGAAGSGQPATGPGECAEGRGDRRAHGRRRQSPGHRSATGEAAERTQGHQGREGRVGAVGQYERHRGVLQRRAHHGAGIRRDRGTGEARARHRGAQGGEGDQRPHRLRGRHHGRQHRPGA